MARLGWDNVAAPDFSGASSGLQSAAAMINQALRGAQTGIAEYSGIQDDKVNKAFALELLKFQDPESYKAALAAGSIPGQDSRRLSAESIGAAGARYNTLLGQANSEIQLNKGRRDDGFEQAFNARAKDIATAQDLRFSGDEAGFNKFMADHPNLMQDMSGRDIMSTANGNRDALREGLGVKSTQQNMDRGTWDFNNRVSDYNTSKRVDELYGRFKSNSLTGDDYMSSVNAALQSNEISGAEYSKLIERGGVGGFADLGSGGGSGLGGVDLSGGGSGDPSALRIITGGGRGNLGLGSVPASVQTLGQAVQFGKGLNNRGQESSAMGLFQITQSTMAEFAPKALGKGWENQRFDDPRVQDAVAAKIFEHASKQPNPVAALRGRWVSLTDADARQMLQVGWERGRDLVSQKESSSNASALIMSAARGAQNATETAAAYVEGNAGNNLPNMFQQLAGSPESPAQTARRLAKENPGFDAAMLEKQIIRLQSDVASSGGNRKKFNSAMAGQAIIDNAGSESARASWYNFAPNFFGGDSVGQGQMVNYDAAKKAGLDYASGSMDDTIAANTVRATNVTVQANAAAAVAQAEARVNAKVRAAQVRGINNPNLSVELADLAAAKREAAGASGMANTPGTKLPGGNNAERKAAAIAKAEASAARAQMLRERADAAAAKASDAAARAKAVADRAAAARRSEQVIADSVARARAGKPALAARPAAKAEDPAFKFWGGVGQGVVSGARAVANAGGSGPRYRDQKRRVVAKPGGLADN